MRGFFYNLRRRREPRPWLGCVGLLLIMLTCGTVTMLAAEAVCYQGLTRRMPVYPDATPIFRSHNWLREYGMGATVLVYESATDENTVRAFYGRAQGTYARDALRFTNPFDQAAENMTRAAYDVTTLEDGDGSQIILYGYCLQ